MKRSLSRLLSPSVSIVVSMLIIAFVYGGCALKVGINRNRNTARETVNVPMTMGRYEGPAVNFNDPSASGSFGGSSTALKDGTVTVLSDGFSPASVMIVAGGTVTWTNDDDGPHQPDADDGLSRDAFSAPVAIDPGERYRVTFLTPGSIAYHDDRTPAFRGVVIVQ